MKTQNLSSKAQQQEPPHQVGDEAVQRAGEDGAAFMQINKKKQKKQQKKNKMMMMKVLEEEAEIDAEEEIEATTTTTPTTLNEPNGEKTDSRKSMLKKKVSEEDPENDADEKAIDATTITIPTTTSNETNGEKTNSRNSKLKKKQLLKETEKADKRGVCYLSRVPPHMDHVRLRHILSQYGDIQRIFLAPKDSAAQVPSKRSRGSQNQVFSEGWIEFTNKSVAKRVANMLNGEQIGGKKRSSLYYDLWNIKYLSKFKWDDLTEELAFKKAVREQKLALELSAAKRERDFYLSRVDQSRALSAIEERLKKKQKVHQDSGQVAKVIRHFPQTKPIAVNAKESKPGLSDDILDAVFGGS